MCMSILGKAQHLRLELSLFGPKGKENCEFCHGHLKVPYLPLLLTL